VRWITPTSGWAVSRTPILYIFGDSIFAHAWRASQIAQTASGQSSAASVQSPPPISLSCSHYVFPIGLNEAGLPNPGIAQLPAHLLEAACRSGQAGRTTGSRARVPESIDWKMCLAAKLTAGQTEARIVLCVGNRTVLAGRADQVAQSMPSEFPTREPWRHRPLAGAK
jgi:hypothetical protein